MLCCSGVKAQVGVEGQISMRLHKQLANLDHGGPGAAAHDGQLGLLSRQAAAAQDEAMQHQYVIAVQVSMIMRTSFTKDLIVTSVTHVETLVSSSGALWRE